MIQEIAPYQLKNEYRPERVPRPDDYCLLFDRQKVLCAVREGKLDLPRIRQLPDTVTYTYLFSIELEETNEKKPERDDSTGNDVDENNSENCICFFTPAGDIPPGPEGFSYQDVWRNRRGIETDQRLMFAIATGKHLTHWYHNNRFCGCCGQRTEHDAKERALSCPSCGNRIYPRLMPAVIVGVIHDDQLLVTKYSDRELPFYALVAGFVEIGESLEECVRREVMEEVGLKVKNIRYYKSQPWGIVDDILTGFYCDVDGDPTVRLDPDELKEGIWVKRGEVPLQPDHYSLTGEMMRIFNEGVKV